MNQDIPPPRLSATQPLNTAPMFPETSPMTFHLRTTRHGHFRLYFSDMYLFLKQSKEQKF